MKVQNSQQFQTQPIDHEAERALSEALQDLQYKTDVDINRSNMKKILRTYPGAITQKEAYLRILLDTAQSNYPDLPIIETFQNYENAKKILAANAPTKMEYNLTQQDIDEYMTLVNNMNQYYQDLFNLFVLKIIDISTLDEDARKEYEAQMEASMRMGKEIKDTIDKIRDMKAKLSLTKEFKKYYNI